jgi:hypothetical protein
MRTFILTKLTQVSAWMGLLVVVGAFFFPRTFLVFVGLVLLLNDDTWLQSKFKFMRDELEKRWKV